MSGICGICEFGRHFVPGEIVNMSEGLLVKAKEARGSYQGRSIALAYSRMFSGQGMEVLDGVRVAADADLLNLEDLKLLLRKEGRPAPQTAAGVMAAMYLLRGDDFVNELDGAFALSLWDEKRNRLLLAIDRLGIKNLYWRLSKSCLSFATRLTALKHNDASLGISQEALVQFLIFSAIPAPLSIYSGAEKIRPGFMLVFEQNQLKQKRYWDVTFEEQAGSVRHWAGRVRDELRASVHRHLAGLQASSSGAFLSGGTDSSTVVAFMSERQAPVSTFSIVFNETPYSEAEFVRTTVEHCKAQANEACLSPEDALRAIPEIAAYYDEPLANSSAIAAYFCGVMARERGVDCLLGGDGGDELFAGNQRYETNKYFSLYSMVPAFMRRLLIEPLAGLAKGNNVLSLPRRYIQRASIPNPRRFFSYNFFLTMRPEEVFGEDILAAAPREHWLRIPEEHFATPGGASELNRLLYLDIKMTLADNDLKKVSGMAELAGVQVRYPLLDHRLAELSARVPANLKLHGFEKRFIFKQAMKGLLPDKILYKKKHGMGVPVSSWLLNDPKLRSFTQDVLHDRRTRERGYFQPGFINRLLDLRKDHVGYYGEIVWYLLTLELWHRQHVDKSVGAACAD